MCYNDRMTSRHFKRLFRCVQQPLLRFLEVDDIPDRVEVLLARERPQSNDVRQRSLPRP